MDNKNSAPVKPPGRPLKQDISLSLPSSIRTVTVGPGIAPGQPCGSWASLAALPPVGNCTRPRRFLSCWRHCIHAGAACQGPATRFKGHRFTNTSGRPDPELMLDFQGLSKPPRQALAHRSEGSLLQVGAGSGLAGWATGVPGDTSGNRKIRHVDEITEGRPTAFAVAMYPWLGPLLTCGRCRSAGRPVTGTPLAG